MNRSTIARTMALALAAGTLGAGAAAAPASAAPVDLFTISPAGADTHFGTNCQASGAPLTQAALDWNLVGNTVTPRVTGDICLQTPSNGIQTQVKLEYYNVNLPGSHSDEIVATRLSNLKTGTGGGLNVFDISRGGLPFNSANVHHVHVVLMNDRANPGTLDDVGTVALDL